MNIWQKIKLGFACIIGIPAMGLLFAVSINTLYKPFMLYWRSNPGSVLSWAALIFTAMFVIVIAGYIASETQKLDIDLKKYDLLIYTSKIRSLLACLFACLLIIGSFSSAEITRTLGPNRRDWMIPVLITIGTGILALELFSIFNTIYPYFLASRKGLIYRRLVYFYDIINWQDIKEVHFIIDTSGKGGKSFPTKYTKIILNNDRILTYNRWLQWVTNVYCIKINTTLDRIKINNKKQKVTAEQVYTKIKESATKYGYADKIKFYDNGKETSFGLDNVIG